MICLHCFNDDDKDSCSILDFCPKCLKNGAWACSGAGMVELAKATHYFELISSDERASIMAEYCHKCGRKVSECGCSDEDW